MGVGFGGFACLPALAVMMKACLDRGSFSDCFSALPALPWVGDFLPFWGVCFCPCGAFGGWGGALPACPALIPQNGFRCALFYFGMGDLRFFGFPFACFWGFLESLLGSGRFFRLMMAGSCPFGVGCFGWGCFGCWVGLPALPACLGWGVGCSCLGCLPALGGVLGVPACGCGVCDALPD